MRRARSRVTSCRSQSLRALHAGLVIYFPVLMSLLSMLGLRRTGASSESSPSSVATGHLATSLLVLLTLPIAAAHPQAETAGPARPALSLAQLLDRVQLRHPLVAAAQARVRAAEAARRTASTLGNPVLGYEVEAAPRGSGMEREVMTTAMLPLEPFYQRGARVRRASAEVRVAEAEARVVTQGIGLDAARTYFETALAQIRLHAQHELVTWLDSVVTYNAARVREGAAAEADLLRSELERDRATAEAARFEADLIRARAALSTYTSSDATGGLADSAGEPAPMVVEVREQPLPLPQVGVVGASPTTGGLSPSALAAAFTTRGELAAARERVAAAAAGVTTERRLFLRELSATVGTKRMEEGRGLIAGFSLPIPLLDQNRGEVARAHAERDAASLELIAEERAAHAAIAGALDAARVLTTRTTQLAARSTDGRPAYLARADEARRIALGAYREGAVPLLTVIDAARAWGEARLAYYEAIYAQHESVLVLLAAQGLDLRLATASLTSSGSR